MEISTFSRISFLICATNQRTKANVCAQSVDDTRNCCRLAIVVRTDYTARHHRCAVILQMNRTSIRIRYTRWKCVWPGAARAVQASHETQRRRQQQQQQNTPNRMSANKNVDKRECAQIQIA